MVGRFLDQGLWPKPRHPDDQRMEEQEVTADDFTVAACHPDHRSIQDCHGNPSRSPHDSRLPMHRRSLPEFELRKHAKPFLDGDAKLHARKMCADTAVDAETKCYVPVVSAI